MNSGGNFPFFRYTRMTMQLFGKYQDWKFGLLEKLISIISCNFLMINIIKYISYKFLKLLFVHIWFIGGVNIYISCNFIFGIDFWKHYIVVNILVYWRSEYLLLVSIFLCLLIKYLVQISSMVNIWLIGGVNIYY